MTHPIEAPSTECRATRKEIAQARVAMGLISLLILQPVFFFWRILINPRAHIPYDIEGFYLPLISYVARCVRQGIAPLWDPYSYAGVPIHADSQAQVFNPFIWLAILAGNHSQGSTLFYWLEALVPLHMMLAGLFAFWLLRRMGLRLPCAYFGATVYQLGGYFASQAQHLSAVCSGAWLPLALLAVFEMRWRISARWIAVLALAVAFSILDGFMPATLVIAIAVVFMLAALLMLRQLSWRAIPAVAAGFVGAALISTVELVPLWQLTRASIASMRGQWLVNGGGLPLQSLVSLLIPNYYHIFEPFEAYRLLYNFTFMYVYCGIATAVLLALAAFFGKASGRVFLALTILCAFWMLGEHTPVYHSIFRRLPGLLRGALYAEYALMAFCFFAAVTGAVVLDRFGKRIPEVLLWAVALFTAYDLIHTGADRPMNSVGHSYKLAGSSDKQIADDLRDLLNPINPPSRIDYLDDTLGGNVTAAGMLELPTADGDNPFMLRRMWNLRKLFCGGNWWDRRMAVNRPGSALLGMLNIEWLVRGSPLPEEQTRAAGLEFKGSLDGVAVYRNPRALPRFFLVPRLRRSPDEQTSFQMLAQPAFNPAEEAIVEGISSDESGLATAPIKVEAYTPNRVQLAVATSGPAFLATSEVLYTGWIAKVNGKPQPLLMTNGAFRGLRVPAGLSEIVMEYHPPLLRLYLFFSSAMMLLALFVALGGKRLRQSSGIRWREILPLLSLRRLTAAAKARINEHRVTLGWLALFVPVTILFYWKILLTRQFSLLTGSEGVVQAYSWLRFWVYSIRHGVLPLWDPYAFSGHSFAGEMQTAAFYPLHLVLALFPLNHHGVFSPYLYHLWWAAAHLLGACFFFLLVREFGLSRFAAFVAGLCFSLGGFTGRVGWPHLLESSIWLPLIFLAVLRAVRAGNALELVRGASLGGLALGMAILAGGFHVVIMDALVIISAAVFYALAVAPKSEWRLPHVLQTATAAGVVLVVGFAAGAIQLLPSVEYSAQAIRFLGQAGALPANEKIPYWGMNDAVAPHGIFMLLLPTAFNGHMGNGEVFNPYLGVFPLLAAVVGIRRNWLHPWVRYLTGLAVAAFLYSLGSFSWFHGVLYAIIPKLWMAREAPRMMYLADFSLALLAAFGIDTLLARGREASWNGLNRVLVALVVACAVCLFVPAVLGKPEISPWLSLSMMLIAASYALFRYLLGGNSGAWARFLIISLILFDLGAFDWSAVNVNQAQKTGGDYLERNLSLEGAVNFLKSQKGLFRVQAWAEPRPNIGDLFGVPETFGGGVTLPKEYAPIMDNRDLLNVRYVLKAASSQDPGHIVYQDSAWKVYENPTGLPRAWIVHDTVAVDSGTPWPPFDKSRTALVERGVSIPLEPAAASATESVEFVSYTASHLEFRVHAQARGLLMLSETFYPGWRATVNGTREPIYRVDGDLRGIVVPAGDSRVVLDYVPSSFYLGALLSVLALGGTAYLGKIANR